MNDEALTKNGLPVSNMELIEKLVFGEIEGKNKAIHAYDDMTWKIRTGFLTLLFGGWGVLLKAIVEADAVPPSPTKYAALVSGMLVLSFGFAAGAWFIDRSYVRRKFRVILALDHLETEIKESHGDIRKISVRLLHVAGDNAEMPYKGSGYREALRTELLIYLIPLVALVLGIALVVPWWR